MKAIDRLNEILQKLKDVETEMKGNLYAPASPYAVMLAIAELVDDLPDITQQLETAIIEVEEMKENFENVWSEIGRC